jgi:UDP-glucose 4-epimerase
MQTVLITGGTGFIGRRVVADLAARGAKCFVVTRGPVKTKNPAVEFVTCDLTAPESVSHLVPIVAKADTIIHIAALIPPAVPLQPGIVPYVNNNILATGHLLEAMTQEKTALPSLVFTSTLDVYGIPQRVPVDEDHPTAPLTVYAATKLSAENLLTTFERAGNLPLTILRLSHVYGPGEPVIKAIPRFIENVMNNEPPVIYGDGEDTRDYVYVGDVADAIIKAVDRRLSGRFNISGGRGHTIREVAETIIRMSGKALRPIYRERRQPASQIVISNEKAREQLEWAPRTSLAEGLAQQYDYARKEGNK